MSVSSPTTSAQAEGKHLELVKMFSTPPNQRMCRLIASLLHLFDKEEHAGTISLSILVQLLYFYSTDSQQASSHKQIHPGYIQKYIVHSIT